MNSKKDIINNILLSKTHRENENLIICLIPELINMIGFDHNHPHHHLDVWEHTLLTLDNLNSNDLSVVLAALLHDIGKPFSYQDKEIRHFKGHAIMSRKIAKSILERLEYDQNFIDEVLFLVRYHDTSIEKLDIKNEKIKNKLLDLQYADAKAHHPDYIEKRLKLLDKINEGTVRKKV